MPLSRRALLRCCAALPPLAMPLAAASPVRRHFAHVDGPGPAPPPGREPYGFELFAVPPEGTGPVLSWTRVSPRGPARLRLAVAVDQREEKRLSAALARSGRQLGSFDLRFSCPYETADLALNARDADAAAKEGVRLTLAKGTSPLWLLREGVGTVAAPGLMPQLMTYGGARPLEEYKLRMGSLDSLAPCTWMEGCVLDALRDLGLRDSLRRHLAYYFERPGGEVPDQMFGVEATLPVAALAAERKEHPAVDRALAYWKSRQDAEGSVQGAAATAEGCYTVGYPLAMTARARRLPELREMALRQLRVRQRRLATGEGLWLRAYPDGRRTFRNWSRGVAWYFLGITRTLAALGPGEDLGDLKAECRRVAAWAVRYQRADGLWSCFLDAPSIAPDTSGSSGIAAALALGVRQGWLEEAYLEAARKTARGVESRLTPDGFLTGVSQSNKAEAGEQLQRSDYRVTLQFGMGLYGQLLAALGGRKQRSAR